MNTRILKTMIKPFLPMLPDLVSGLEEKIHQNLSSVELENEEVRAVYLIMTSKSDEKETYIVTAALDLNDKVTRTIEVVLAKEFLLTLIKENL